MRIVRFRQMVIKIIFFKCLTLEMSNTSEVHDEDQKHEVVEEEDRTDEDTLDIRPSIFHLVTQT